MKLFGWGTSEKENQKALRAAELNTLKQFIIRADQIPQIKAYKDKH